MKKQQTDKPYRIYFHNPIANCMIADVTGDTVEELRDYIAKQFELTRYDYAKIAHSDTLKLVERIDKNQLA